MLETKVRNASIVTTLLFANKHRAYFPPLYDRKILNEFLLHLYVDEAFGKLRLSRKKKRLRNVLLTSLDLRRVVN